MEGLVVNQDLKARFVKNIHFTDFCWAWKGIPTQSGYGAIKSKGKTYAAHRVSYYLHKGEIPDGLFVCHSCDNKWCVNPDHLWLGSRSDNAKDAVKKGLWNKRVLHSRLR